MTNLGENIQFAGDQRKVDKINSEFYGKIMYPWAPGAFEKFNQQGFWRKMIGQDIGYWNETIIPENANIWVAGCGTNQALFTALKFPDAQVIGSDLSRESLAFCRKNAMQLGVTNLQLKNESINEVLYSKQFDYIICTGVIHHNSEPQISLLKLAKALKPDGILEIMVYNKFHRLRTASFQLAIRMLTNCIDKPILEKELPIARMLANDFKENNFMSHLLNNVQYEPDAAFCDALLQPIEHSYTIKSLEKMGLECNLELLTFTVDQFSQAEGCYDWNLNFKDLKLQELYNELPDTSRWEITNLLQGENSPMLWFYMQRKDSVRLRKSEMKICQEFFNTKFKRVTLIKELYVLGENNNYKREPMPVEFPAQLKNLPYPDEAKEVYATLDEAVAIGRTIEKCNIDLSFNMLNKLRLCLATASSPYLEAYK